NRMAHLQSAGRNGLDAWVSMLRSSTLALGTGPQARRSWAASVGRAGSSIAIMSMVQWSSAGQRHHRHCHAAPGAELRLLRWNRTLPASSPAQVDALAGPGVVADDEYEDPDREKGVNEPAKRRGHDVEQDADDRPLHL